ncbi:hypothetical protein TVAG_362730 [Trichomonas vaginalis G3]|uniref:Uncharacterized protein n=1 Tax=Trichomonas vaginalis (strain ATCC PRA-98 / G3) TaxID=412133 RepID=A2E651_TRIV3|nr:hypothetical protein TVAGG3_0366440 [Trichomonas vaginalis G3]EAY11893.1 hypothetical protein TVAG_362730 [Trichomonas vaginalis G3]KAI5532309.1 hypothetical protein TVAGG3_0366440 [Trichomonas vaginalis G3]|eukprot:XP_001324116.1 hypothetical protein [Trichomonas vaginalis G3]
MGKEHWALKTIENENPGPGSYNIGSTFGKDALKYTIRNRYPERKPETSEVPLRAIPDTSTSRKVLLPPHDPNYIPVTHQQWQTPGPEYMPPDMGKKPVSARSTRSRKSLQATTSPRSESRKSYSTNPYGPAEYNTRRDLINPHSQMAIGTRPKEYGLKGESPGPDAYNPQSPSRKNFSKACSFGARNDIITPRSCSPGPIYNPNPEMNTRMYKIRERVPMPVEKIDITPSPGNFDLKPFGSDTKPVTFPKSFQRDIKQEFGNSPAPYYNLPSQFDNPKGMTIGGGPREPSTPRSGDTSQISSPRSARSMRSSPRTADSSSRRSNGTSRSIDFSRAQRIHERYIQRKAEEGTPGPGYYDIKSESSQRSYKMHKPMEILKKYREDDNILPGPGYYNPDYTATKPSTPAFSFKDDCGAVSQRVLEPAPPFYDVHGKTRTMKTSPRFSIGNRTPYKDRDCSTQDAGYYMLPDTNTGPFHSIHLRDRHELVPE